MKLTDTVKAAIILTSIASVLTKTKLKVLEALIRSKHGKELDEYVNWYVNKDKPGEEFIITFAKWPTNKWSDINNKYQKKFKKVLKYFEM